MSGYSSKGALPRPFSQLQKSIWLFGRSPVSIKIRKVRGHVPRIFLRSIRECRKAKLFGMRRERTNLFPCRKTKFCDTLKRCPELVPDIAFFLFALKNSVQFVQLFFGRNSKRRHFSPKRRIFVFSHFVIGQKLDLCRLADVKKRFYAFHFFC